MASTSYKDVTTGVNNMPSGVKAKLQKWMGKANTRVLEKRVLEDEPYPAEMASQETQLKFETTNSNYPGSLIPIHVWSRSAPIPMPDVTEQVVLTRRRKTSVITPPTYSPEEESERELDNRTIDHDSKNGIPRGLKSRSVGRNDSSNTHSSGCEKQNVANSCSRNTGLRDQIGSTQKDTRDEGNNRANFRTLEIDMKEGVNSRVARKVNKSAAREKSGENSEESGGSDGEKTGSRSGSPSNGGQKVSIGEQIQTRLQKWVEKASSFGSKRNRASSEESMSSTDDSLNPTENLVLRTAGADGGERKEGNQAKEMRELELALKELVENVGVRANKTTVKETVSRKTSLQNLRPLEVSRQEEKGSSAENIKRNFQFVDNVTEKARSRGSRNASSSSESDAGLSVTDIADGVINEEIPALQSLMEQPIRSNGTSDQIDRDLDNGIFMKDSDRTDRELNNNCGPHTRRSVALQEVMTCETLTKEFTTQGDSDTGEKTVVNDVIENSAVNLFTNRSIEDYLSEAVGDKTRSGETGGLKQPVRPGLKKRSTAPTLASLKVCPDLSVRESMRNYLNFKDAELSAFAVECVRHANKKKQIPREEDTQGTIKKTEGTIECGVNAADSIHSKDPTSYIVISSAQHERKVEGLKIPDKLSTPGAVENENPSSNVFARTAEEAAWFEKESRAQDPGAQRLYKFPSLPTFYIPEGGEENAYRKRSKTDKFLHRRSVATMTSSPNCPTDSSLSFPESPSLVSDPFYHDEADSAAKRSNNEAKSPEKRRPMMRTRKLSVPSRSELYPKPSSNIINRLHISVEALI